MCGIVNDIYYTITNEYNTYPHYINPSSMQQFPVDLCFVKLAIMDYLIFYVIYAKTQTLNIIKYIVDIKHTTET